MKILNIHNFNLKHRKTEKPNSSIQKFEKYIPVGEMVKELTDVYVMSPTGLILDRNFEPIYSTANEIIYWKGKPKLFPEQIKLYGREYLRKKDVWVDRAKGYLESYIDECRKNIIKSKEKTLIYASSATEKLVFGHFYDTIQRLYNIQDRDHKTHPLLISAPSRILDFELFLGLLGLNQNYVVRPKKYALLHVEKLIVPEMSVGPAGMAKDVHSWLFQKLILQNKSIDKNSNHKLKLYLDRSNVARQNNRDFLNSDLVGKFLENSGFVSHKKFKTLNEVLNAYYNADMVFGAHGAAFINCIYCNKDCNIFEFVASNRLIKALARMPKKTENHWLFEVEADSNYTYNMDLKFLESLVKGDVDPSTYLSDK